MFSIYVNQGFGYWMDAENENMGSFVHRGAYRDFEDAEKALHICVENGFEASDLAIYRIEEV